MDDTKKMLRAIINGQSAMKSELLGEIKKVDRKVDNLSEGMKEGFKRVGGSFKEVNKRMDRIGLQVARLEDDAPTREEHDGLEHRVTKLEDNFASL